jgi:2-keto-4-pentenoate hydratase
MPSTTTRRHRHKTLWAVVCATAAVWSGASQAACLDDAAIAQWVQRYEARQPAANPPADMSDADSACTRAKFTRALEAAGRKVLGYKAGLTNPAVQQRFGTDKPVWGKLYEGMLLTDGSAVPAAFGARPLFEADMLVRVKDAGINQARTPWEVMQHIDAIAPFMELPDLMVQAPPQLNGAGVGAINVGARLGVVGKTLPVPATRGERALLLNQLQTMDVVVSDSSGAELARGKGADILGHPLQAVVWLAQALAAEQLVLQPGDWVSLGSFSPLMPPQPGQQVQVRYDGVPGLQPVTVRFE